MARIPLDPPRTPVTRLAEWHARRTYGVLPDPLAAMAHHPGVLVTDAGFEMSLVSDVDGRVQLVLIVRNPDELHGLAPGQPVRTADPSSSPGTAEAETGRPSR
jgi:hypothetical protein